MWTVQLQIQHKYTEPILLVKVARRHRSPIGESDTATVDCKDHSPHCELQAQNSAINPQSLLPHPLLFPLGMAWAGVGANDQPNGAHLIPQKKQWKEPEEKLYFRQTPGKSDAGGHLVRGA